jgi:TonB family protein
LDVLLAEIVCTVFWINPFAWLLKYDIRENLEFLADKDVVHAGFDPKGYQYHLLRLSYQQSPIRMGNNFNVSQLQNRIKMMNKKRTSQAGWSKYLLTLPLFGSLLLVSYTCKAKTSNESMVSTTIESVSTAKSAETIKTDVPPPPPVPKKSTIRFVAPKIEKGEKKTVKFTPPVLIDAADSVYMSVEQIPEYPGGTEALIKYIRENLHYPQSAKEAGIEGRVVIRFVVSKTGKVEDIKVMRGLSKECDDEAVRVVKGMPQWKAGMNKGKPVNVYFTLPIEYRYKE